MSAAVIDPHTFDELQANAGADFVADVHQQILLVLLNDGDDLGSSPPGDEARQFTQVARCVVELDEWNQLLRHRVLNRRIETSSRTVDNRPHDTDDVRARLGDLGKLWHAILIGGPDDHFVDATQRDLLAAAIVQMTALDVVPRAFGPRRHHGARRRRKR